MIVIQIVDWRSYLLRSDIKKHKAFKLSTGSFTSPRMWALTPEARSLFVVLLDLACQGSELGCIRQTPNCLATMNSLNTESLMPALEQLKTIGLIEICSESVQVLHGLDTEKTQILHRKNTGKTRRKPSLKTEVIDLTDDELDLGRKWLDMAVSEMPHRASDPKWHAAEFGTELKKVGQAVGLDNAGMLKVFHYVSADTFWRPNTCAPKSLLKVNKEGVRKIDNILTRMKRPAERLSDIREEQRSDTTRPVGPNGMTMQDIAFLLRK
jgi:hypothetical protein